MTQKMGTADQYVINPYTNRPVKTSGQTFASLVREGVFNTPSPANPSVRTQKTKQVVANASDRTQAYRLKTQLEREKPLPSDRVYSVASNGKAVLVKSKKAPTLKPENLVPMMTKASVEVNKRLMKDPVWSKVLEQPPENLDAKTRSQLENMILQELVSTASKKPSPPLQTLAPTQPPQVKQQNKISSNNVNAKKTTQRRFVIQAETEDSDVSTATRKPIRVTRRTAIALPSQRNKRAVFSDTDNLTTDAYETFADETEADDDDGSTYADD